MSVGVKATLLVVVAIGILFICILKINRNKKAELCEDPQAGAEITEMLDTATAETEETAQTAVEEVPQVVVIRPDEYSVDETDTNLFINSLYKDFTIRTMQGMSVPKSKDIMIFTTSFPWEFEQEEYQAERFKKMFISAVPQLVKIESGRTHELMLYKSSACKWEDIKDGVLKFMFYELHKRYAWKFEKQTVCVSTVPNEQIRSFDLRVETKYHLDLGRRLMSIKGITPGLISSDGYPSCMDHDGRYNFNLEKARSYTWEELLPEIEKVITEYFIAGVEFKNIPSEYSPADFARAAAGSFEDDDFDCW